MLVEVEELEFELVELLVALDVRTIPTRRKMMNALHIESFILFI